MARRMNPTAAMRPATLCAVLPLLLTACSPKPGVTSGSDAGASAPDSSPPAPAPREPREEAPAPDPGPMTVLLAERAGEFCTGEVMDSDGYRRTLTKQVAVSLKGSLDEQVRSVIAAATSGMCRTVMESVEIKVEGGVARIPPISAWAGASIVMCSCRPEVEVNLLRVPGISRVVWEEAGGAH